jgi:hypothetical protein
MTTAQHLAQVWRRSEERQLQNAPECPKNAPNLNLDGGEARITPQTPKRAKFNAKARHELRAEIGRAFKIYYTEHPFDDDTMCFMVYFRNIPISTHETEHSARLHAAALQRRADQRPRDFRSGDVPF